MLRLMVRVESDEWVFGFPQNDVVIGAASMNGLVLDHETVAARHARITHDRGQVTITSLDRAHPTRVNAQDVARSVVREGDVIDIGAYRLGILDRDPPGLVEKDFLDAIARAPHDDAPRAVYGDWLEESGRLEDAAFLRAQIEVRRLASDNARFLELSETIRELAPRMPYSWRRAVARPAIENCSFEPGVQFEVQCPKNWDDLERTEKPDERWCKSCKKRVYYASTIPAARRLAIAGQCVSVDLVVPRFEGDLEPQPIQMRGAMLPPRYRTLPPGS
ncbi:MAG: TIGR02996 domain-containing protein [Labilithrix sp.]